MYLTAGASSRVTFGTWVCVERSASLLCGLYYSLCNRQVRGADIWPRQWSLLTGWLWAAVPSSVAGFGPLIVGPLSPYYLIMIITWLSVSLSVLGRCGWASYPVGLFVSAGLLTARLLVRSVVLSGWTGWPLRLSGVSTWVLLTRFFPT